MSGKLRAMWTRMLAVAGRRDADADLDDELRAHVEMAAEEHRRRGMSAAEARREALREFGGVTQVRERFREQEGWLWLENLRRDAAYALRQMRRSPGFAATVIGTLALGIGAATAMFTVVDHVVLAPVPYRAAGRLVAISESGGGNGPRWGPSWLDIEAWRQQSRAFAEIAFSGSGLDDRSFLEGRTGMLEVSGVAVSDNLFATLGVAPALGRGFLPQAPSFTPGKNAGTIVLSDAVWRAAFAADRGIVGRVVRINHTPYAVVGVMPAGFRYPAGNWSTGQIWVPIALSKLDARRSWDSPRYSVVARLRPGASLPTAVAEMAVIQKRVAAQYPDAESRSAYGHAEVLRYVNTVVDLDVRRALVALFAAAGLLWLIASVNVTNLLLARSTARQREMAVRGALGASRSRIAQQMIVEALVLSGAAGALGIALAILSVKLMAHEIAVRLPLPVPIRPDAWILALLVGLTLVSALLAAAWPAWTAAHAPIEPALRQGSVQAGTGRRQHRMRHGMVIVEIALSLTLLVGCGLLLRTLYTLRRVPLGYRTDHIVVAHLSIPEYRYGGKNMTAELYEPLLDRVQHLHGIQAAGLMTEVPLGGTFAVQMSIYLKGRTVAAWFKGATPGVEKVFGLRMAAGRFFNNDDTPTSQPVIVVNQAFARLWSPDKQNPAALLGTKQVELKKNAPTEIVGVLDDTHQFSVSLPSQPEITICLPQLTPDANFYKVMDGVAMDLALRTDLPVRQVLPELKDVLRQTDPALANSTITTMDEIVEDSYGSQRLAAHLLEIFGATALLLCVAGLYGLLAYVVSQRTRELGVRIALGAQRGALLAMVLRQASAMLLAGVAVGLALALAAGKLFRGFLFGVTAHDGWALVGAAAVLLASGLLAAWLPARRAAGIDPMRALRTE